MGKKFVSIKMEKKSHTHAHTHAHAQIEQICKVKNVNFCKSKSQTNGEMKTKESIFMKYDKHRILTI